MTLRFENRDGTPILTGLGDAELVFKIIMTLSEHTAARARSAAHEEFGNSQEPQAIENIFTAFSAHGLIDDKDQLTGFGNEVIILFGLSETLAMQREVHAIVDDLIATFIAKANEILKRNSPPA